MCKELVIIIKNDKVIVSSLDVAENFNKKHDKVLRDIKELKCSKEFWLTNFGESKYDNRGKKYPMYLITKDGFTILAMGYAGKKAMVFKENYIKRFNQMQDFIIEKQSQEWLQTRKQGRLVRRSETDSLKLLLEYAIKNGSDTYLKQPNRLYSQYTRLVNSTIGITTGEREVCTWKVLITLQTLEDIIQHVVIEEMENETDYHEIYKICKNKCNEMIKYAYLPEQKLLR